MGGCQASLGHSPSGRLLMPIVVSSFTVGAWALGVAAPSSSSDRTASAAPPSVTVSHVIGGPVFDVAVGEAHAYVNVGGRLTALDASDPNAPAMTGTALDVGSTRGLVVRGSVAYAAVFRMVPPSFGGGLLVVDLSDPLAPCCARVEPVSGNAGAVDVALDGDRAWVLATQMPVAVGAADGEIAQSTYGAVDLFDLADPMHPRRIGSSQSGYIGSDAVAAKGHLYVARPDASGGVDIYGMVDGTRPTRIGDVALGEGARAVAVSGDRLFVAAGSAVHVLDLTDPAAPAELLRVPLTSGTAIAAEGLRFLVGTTDGHLHSYDVSDPGAPVALGSDLLPSSPGAIALDRDVAHVALGGSGHRLESWPADRAPSQLSDLPTTGSCNAVATDGDVLYAALGSGRVAVIDRSTPGERPVSSMVEWAPSSLPAAADGYVYGLRGSTLEILDARDPTSPRPAGSLADVPVPAGAALADSSCLVLNYGGSGLRTIDVRNTARPVFSGTVADPDWRLTGVAAAGSHAFAVDQGKGLRVFDVSDCALPRQVAEMSVPRATGPVALLEGSGQLYVATSQSVDTPLYAPPLQMPQPTAPPPVPGQMVLVVDVADPVRPRSSGSWAVPGQVGQLVARGRWAHAGYMHTRSGTYGESVATRSDTGLELGSSWNRAEYSFGLSAAEDSLYVLDGGGGLFEAWFGAVETPEPPTATPGVTPDPPSRVWLPWSERE